MLKIALLAAGASALMIGTALAADIEAPPSAYDWSGLYLGLHAGYGWGASDSETDANTEWDHDIDGFVGGLHGGYNLQADSFLVGLEGDIDFSDIDGSGDCSNPDYECSTDTDWLASVRARLGFAADQFLVYATGGVAFTDLAISNDNGLGDADTQSESAVGFVVGGGAEYALNESFSLRAEVLYYDFGKTDFEFDNSPVEIETDVNFTVVRAGASWHF